MTTQEIRKLLGQIFFIGFDGLEISDSTKKFIQENDIGGVTLFANNYESPAQVAELINSIQALRKELPLAIAVDHEGGKVQRFRKSFTRFPEARTIGDLNSPKIAYECAEIMANELRAVGINIVFAPVADINTNPNNPVIGRRSFGENEEIVSKMVSAYVRGFLTHGVHPVVKHFPGHGDTKQDSHFHLPKVKTDLQTLRDRELKPFLKAFKSKCEMVMSAHIIVEGVDPKLPGTLSEKILREILRGELGFNGIIFSDDMEMKAMVDHFGIGEAPLKALCAGVNVLLYHTEPFQTKAFDALMTLLTSPEGKSALPHLQDSAIRLREYKLTHWQNYTPVNILDIHNTVGNPKHLALAEKIENGTAIS